MTSDITSSAIGYSEIASIVSSATASSNSNGWFKIGNTLVNWGMVEYTNGGAYNPGGTVTFTKPYASNFKPSVVISKTRHAAGDIYVIGPSQDSVTNTKFVLEVDGLNSTAYGSGNKQQVYWIAIGKG